MRRISLLPAAALLALAACGEASAPKGRAGTVAARVYVDRDASASLTAADSLLANVPVTLTASDGTTQTANTDATGTATFSGVAPGSYRLAVTGNVPTGTALVTNPSPSAVVSFQGGTSTVDFRFVFYPGSITGRIYREDNNTPGFQAGADTPAPGLWVWLRLDSAGAAGRKIDSVQTNAEGVYTFPRVAPGSYYLEFEKPSTIQYTGTTTQQVSVVANQSTTDATTRTFTGSLVTSIAVARTKAVGSPVAVKGWVTVAPNTFISGTGGVNSEIWVQDSTGGIASFPVPSSSGYTVGQQLQVSGVIGTNAGALQIGTTANPPAITATGGPTVVFAPKAITVPQARAFQNEGQLVSVGNLEVVSLGTGTTAYTVFAINAAGDTLQIRVSTGTGIAKTSWTIGQRYNVTGVLSRFNAAAQLKPRSASDITPGAPITPIGTLRTQPTGTTATVVGNVTVRPGSFTSGSGGPNSEVWVQDATGGIAVFSVPTADSATYRYGDVVEVSGTTSVFSGQLQIGSPTVTRLRAGTPVVPLVQTGTEINARTNEGKLVTIQNCVMGAVPTSGNSFNLNCTAPDGQTVQIRVIGVNGAVQNTGLTRSDFTAGTSYTFTGVLSQFNGTAQIKPRQRSDVTTP